MGDERLANLLAALALALTDHIAAATERATGHTGAGPAALIALRDLLAGRSVDNLRRAVGLTHSGAVRMVDRLVADGLAARGEGADRRSVALTLTPRGRRLAARAQEARRAAVDEVLQVLDDRERAELAGMVEKLVAAAVDRRMTERAGGDEPPGGWLCRMCDPVACGRPDGRCPAANAATR